MEMLPTVSKGFLAIGCISLLVGMGFLFVPKVLAMVGHLITGKPWDRMMMLELRLNSIGMLMAIGGIVLAISSSLGMKLVTMLGGLPQ